MPKLRSEGPTPGMRLEEASYEVCYTLRHETEETVANFTVRASAIAHAIDVGLHKELKYGSMVEIQYVEKTTFRLGAFTKGDLELKLGGDLGILKDPYDVAAVPVEPRPETPVEKKVAVELADEIPF